MKMLAIRSLEPFDVEYFEERLEQHDAEHMGKASGKRISIGLFDGDKRIAGIDGQMTSFHIFYISTVYVEHEYRRMGYGRLLMEEIEKRAIQCGANMIRLDTFDWQGKDFYLAMDYKLAGAYTNEKDGFSEYFFYKMIG